MGEGWSSCPVVVNCKVLFWLLVLLQRLFSSGHSASTRQSACICVCRTCEKNSQARTSGDWAGAGAPEGVHAGGRWGPMARRRRRFLQIFFLFSAIFYLFSWEFGVLAAMLSRLATACRRR